MHPHFTRLICVFLLICALPELKARAEDSFVVRIRVDAGKTHGELKPIWRFFGADEPNYGYMKDGKTLLSQLGELHRGRSFSGRTTCSLRGMERRRSNGAQLARIG